MYDSIIIGAGPAGLTAALYLARYEKKILVLSGDLGGQAATSGEVGNYPGFDLISGEGLTNKMADQLKQYKNLEVKFPLVVEQVTKTGDQFVLKEGAQSFRAKTVIITAGKRHRTLGLEEEAGLVGKGVSYCATCDGPFAKGKKAVVVGGGNSAADAALILGKIASEVTVLNLNEKMNAEQIRIDRIEGSNNIKLINQAKTVKIESAGGLVSAVVYENADREQTKIEANMIFVEIGYEPNSDIFKDLVELNQNKEIVIENDNSTKTPGLFAAGDITSVIHKQIIVACGEGAKAAMSVNQYLEKG